MFALPVVVSTTLRFNWPRKGDRRNHFFTVVLNNYIPAVWRGCILTAIGEMFVQILPFDTFI